jgi:hypothetical protein
VVVDHVEPFGELDRCHQPEQNRSNQTPLIRTKRGTCLEWCGGQRPRQTAGCL